MNNLTLLLLLAVGLFGFSAQSHAYIYSAGGEEISLVEDLPDSDEWNYNGDQVDACVLHKQFWILWVPLWNWDARYVLAESGSDEFYELEDENLKKRLEDEYGDAASAIPFWDKIGGKLIAPIILLLLGVIGSSSKEDDESDESEQTD